MIFVTDYNSTKIILTNISKNIHYNNRYVPIYTVRTVRADQQHILVMVIDTAMTTTCQLQTVIKLNPIVIITSVVFNCYLWIPVTKFKYHLHNNNVRSEKHKYTFFRFVVANVTRVVHVSLYIYIYIYAE